MFLGQAACSGMRVELFLGPENAVVYQLNQVCTKRYQREAGLKVEYNRDLYPIHTRSRYRQQFFCVS